MKRYLLVIILLVAGIYFYAYAQGKEDKKFAQFELEINKEKHDVFLDTPLEIKTPKGENLTLIFRQKEILHYMSGGIEFDYHRDMKVTAKEAADATIIKIECADSPLIMLQVYNKEKEAAEVSDSLFNGLKKAMKARGAKGVDDSESEIEITVAKEKVTGKKIEWSLGKEEFAAACYGLKLSGKTIGVLSQYMAEDEALSEKYFPIVFNSLKISK